MAQVQIKRVSHRHHAIIDWLVAHPHVKDMGACCKALSVSRSWLSIVMNSDAFREEFERGRSEISDTLQRDLIRTSFEASIRANEKLMTYMEGDVDKLVPLILLDTGNATADRHYGPKTINGAGSVTKETVREFEVEKGALLWERERIR